MRQYRNEFTTRARPDSSIWQSTIAASIRQPTPILNDPQLPVFLGLDGSYQHDSTAIAATTFDTKEQKVRLVAHKIFTPTPDQPVDFGAVEAELLDMRRRLAVQAIFYDPYQLAFLSQRMIELGLPMESFTQSSSNLEAAATNLAELIRHHSFSTYADAEIRLAMSRTVAVESPRGVRISKTKASHRIDIIAAISFAAFAAVRGGQAVQEYAFIPLPGSSTPYVGSSELGRQQRLDAADDARERFARQHARGRHGKWSGY